LERHPSNCPRLLSSDQWAGDAFQHPAVKGDVEVRFEREGHTEAGGDDQDAEMAENRKRGWRKESNTNCEDEEGI
jgi:hypothetical protein